MTECALASSGAEIVEDRNAFRDCGILENDCGEIRILLSTQSEQKRFYCIEFQVVGQTEIRRRIHRIITGLCSGTAV